MSRKRGHTLDLTFSLNIFPYFRVLSISHILSQLENAGSNSAQFRANSSSEDDVESRRRRGGSWSGGEGGEGGRGGGGGGGGGRETSPGFALSKNSTAQEIIWEAKPPDEEEEEEEEECVGEEEEVEGEHDQGEFYVGAQSKRERGVRLWRLENYELCARQEGWRNQKGSRS